MKFGFIGVGTLSAAVITAMAEHYSDRTIYLSPRSRDKSLLLSHKFPQVHRMESNQDVVDESDIIFFGMLPPQFMDVVSELNFEKRHTVVSFVAGISASDVAELVAPAQHVCRVTPITTIERNAGPITMFPEYPEVVGAFKGLGELITVASEQEMKLLGCSSAILSTYFEFQNTVINWAASQGVDRETASIYIRNLLSGLSAVGLHKRDDELAALPEQHQTPGGLNERVRNGLRASSWFDQLTGQLDILNTRVDLTTYSPE